MIRRRFLVASACLGLVLAAYACGGDSGEESTSSPDADGGITFDAGTSPVASGDGGATGDDDDTPADGGATTKGDADAGLQGTGVGLRVKFLGQEHSFAASNESSLWAYFAADTTLTPTRDVTTAGALDAAYLANVDVIVLDRLQRVFTADEALALYDWVRAGHGLISITGYGFGDEYVDSLLVNFGVGYGSTISGNHYVPLDPASPIANGVSTLRFYTGRSVTSTGDASVSIGTLATKSIGMATTHELGRSVVFGDDWIVLDEEVDRADDAGAFPARTFWHNTLLWVGGRL